MITKFLIFGIFGYVIFRIVKSKFISLFYDFDNINMQNNQIEDIMVQDPFCKVYFPKKNGISAKIDSKIILFCSIECRDKYIAMKGK